MIVVISWQWDSGGTDVHILKLDLCTEHSKLSYQLPHSIYSHDQPMTTCHVALKNLGTHGYNLICTKLTCMKGSCSTWRKTKLLPFKIRSCKFSVCCSTDSLSFHKMVSAYHICYCVETSNVDPCVYWTGGIVEQLQKSMHTVSSPNLGILLIDFLHIFGVEIDFTKVRLVTKVCFPLFLKLVTKTIHGSS